jgi:hypothetical protein
MPKIDELVKSRKCVLSVIPARAGIQCSRALENSWTPFFNGVTTFCETIKIDELVKSARSALGVIPANAGIQFFHLLPFSIRC